ncbi:hypothetical protein [Candidatus Rhabdochlamydia sp. T3358]|uniref:hypothetical protein n=1 Tax=Candidatus Rhabdochlamydia sp. T3358 TaxID=2099795 RepID=UPI0010B2A2CB|nr:hypothetical protein [Candidatus Rhabdochlamydia sp. T3358]VHO02128.1 hypothetical protein RHT_00436 [Candidatus Rhabdochlamydia sp. T3358]
MKTKGIRISDIKDGKCISLSELLENIPNEKQFFWALLWLDVTPLKDEGNTNREFMSQTELVAWQIKRLSKRI